MLVGAGNPRAAYGLVHRERDAPNRRVMPGAAVFVGPGSVREQSRDRGVHLTSGGGFAVAGHGTDEPREFRRPYRQVLGDIVEDLPAVVAAGMRPCGRRVRRLDGVADVFAVPLGDFGE